MTDLERLVQASGEPAPDLRVGTPEREAAQEALEEHHDAGRLDAAEFEQRSAACEVARTRAELLLIFADLPGPHPDLSESPGPSSDTDDDVSLLGWTVGLMLFLGLPVAVVLGLVYRAWWSLALPVGVSVALLYIEHLLTRTDKEPAPGGAMVGERRHTESP